MDREVVWKDLRKQALTAEEAQKSGVAGSGIGYDAIFKKGVKDNVAADQENLTGIREASGRKFKHLKGAQ